MSHLPTRIGTSLRKHLWAVIVLPATLVVVFFPVLFGGKLLLPTDMIGTMSLPYSENYDSFEITNTNVNDGLLQFYPYRAMTKQAWEEGKLSFWNPKILCGYPQSSATFVSYYDVFNLILLLGDMPGSYHLQIVLQLLLAGVGMYLYLLVRGIRPETATLFSSAYMMNGMFISLLLYRWMLGGMCWLPFLLAAIYKLNEAANRRERTTYFVLAIASLAFAMVGGSMQTSTYAAIIVFVVIIIEHTERIGFIRALGRVVGIVAGGTLLAALMWLPILELFLHVLFGGGSIHSTSVFSSYNFIHRLWSVPLLGTFIMPQLAAGPISLHRLANAYTIDFTGSIGLIPLLAGVIGIVRYRKSKGLRSFALLAVLGIALPIATPLYSVLYHRFFIVFFTAAIILGAHVVDEWFRGEFSWHSVKKWFWSATAIYVAIALGVITFTILVALRPDEILQRIQNAAMSMKDTAAPGGVFHEWIMQRCKDMLTHYSLMSPTMFIPLLAIGASLVFVYQFKNGRHMRFVMMGCIAATLLQLGYSAVWWLPMTDPNRFPAYPKTAETDLILADTNAPRIFSPTLPPVDQFVLMNNVNNMYGINDIRGFESLVPRSIATLQEQLKNPHTTDARLLGLFNTAYVLTGKDTLNDDQYTKLLSGRVSVYYNNHVKPRFYMAYRTEHAGADSIAIRRIADSSFDGTTALTMDSDLAMLSAPSENHISIISQSDDEVELLVQTDSGGLLVVTDTYYPGWICIVNNYDTPIHRVNYCMRGIVVPAGTSTVRMTYSPVSVRLGLYISLATAVGLCALYVTARKRSDS